MVQTTLISRTLSLIVNNGVSSGGTGTTVTKNYTHIKADATAEDMMTVANALASLMNNSVSNVYHVDKSELETVEG